MQELESQPAQCAPPELDNVLKAMGPGADTQPAPLRTASGSYCCEHAAAAAAAAGAGVAAIAVGGKGSGGETSDGDSGGVTTEDQAHSSSSESDSDVSFICHLFQKMCRVYLHSESGRRFLGVFILSRRDPFCGCRVQLATGAGNSKNN